MNGQMKIFHGLSCHSWSKMKLCPQTYYEFILLLIFTLNFYKNHLIFNKKKKSELSKKIYLSHGAASIVSFSEAWIQEWNCPPLDSIAQLFEALVMDELVPVSHYKIMTNSAQHWWHPWDLATLMHIPPSWQLWWLVELWKFSVLSHVVFFFSHSPPPTPFCNLILWVTQGNNISPQNSPVCLDLQHCNHL